MTMRARASLTAVIIALMLGGRTLVEAAAPVTLTNKLATAASPYLREAARQPVAWQPWGDEAFRLARALDRPILLDIGAVWCHWCHVMDEETYGHAEVARLINEAFVAIKVDRDERPDIDARYQRAVQALVRHGGWPLTVFLTPDGRAFHGGGTFFPDDRYGRPGFKTVLPRIAAAYRAERGQVVALAERLQHFLSDAETSSLRSGDLSSSVVKSVAQSLARSFDGAHGGFGQGPKFPAGSSLALTFRLYAEDSDEQMLKIAVTTLDGMARGGIHDHLGGGFHRYAVDREWRVPHFEKMDYDNAQLLVSYLGAYQATKDTRYREVAEGILAYVNRVMSDQPRGGFYAHQDADMRPGDDGGYYTWTIEEVRAALSKDEAAVIERYFDIDDIGQMRAAPGRNVLAITRGPEEIARELTFPAAKIIALIRSGTTTLLDVRNQRPTPYVDRTMFADRNGMMVSAYLEAFKVLGREDAKAFGLKTLDVVLIRLRSNDGGLYHALSDGSARVPGFLADYVWVAASALEAFQVTGDPRYLRAARDLMDQALRRFWDPTSGGFFDLQPEPSAPGPLRRATKSIQDTSAPSPNAIAALVLDELTYLTNVPTYRQRAEQLLRAFAGGVSEGGPSAAGYALALDVHLRPPAHAVVIGSPSDARTVALWRAALAAFRPGKLVATYDPTRVKPADLPSPVAAAMKNSQAAGVPQAFVCVATSCSLPTSDPNVVAGLVAGFERRGGGTRAIP
jgi:uncharacterized protein